VIDAGSPRALIYMDADLQHRLLVFSEADSLPAGEDNPAASAIRNLLQDHRLHYEVVVKDPETGRYIVMEVNKEGPAVLITTSTKPLGGQLGTRLFALDIPYDLEQLRSALKEQARQEVNEAGEIPTPLIAFQAYLQSLAPWDVLVPYAESLANEIGKTIDAPRILRDHSRILALIKAVALLRHIHRQVNRAGRLMATIDDYRYVKNLVGEMYESSLSGVSKEIRNIVEIVDQLTKKAKDSIMIEDIRKCSSFTKTQARRYVKRALDKGFLVNKELRKSYPYNLSIGEPLPVQSGLPEADKLTTGCRDATTGATTRESVLSEAKLITSGCGVAPSTDDIKHDTTTSNGALEV
jgi:hypothetical protein